jgi:hypothetical protein
MSYIFFLGFQIIRIASLFSLLRYGSIATITSLADAFGPKSSANHWQILGKVIWTSSLEPFFSFADIVYPTNWRVIWFNCSFNISALYIGTEDVGTLSEPALSAKLIRKSGRTKAK